MQKLKTMQSQNINESKPYELRGLVRVPLVSPPDQSDFKPNLKAALVAKFGADRDVGIIVGPENDQSAISCKAGMTGDAEYDEVDDSQNCITYDAAIDGDTTDVHVLTGSDESYNMGGIQIDGKCITRRQTNTGRQGRHPRNV